MGTGTSLDISPSSTANQGPTSVGADFSAQFSSPFAVGRGATASSTASQGGGDASNLPLYLSLAALLLAVGAGAYSLARR